MTTYYVDDDGSNTSPYDTWAKAATTIATAISAASSGDIILVETTHDEVSSASEFNIDLKSSPPGIDIFRVDSSDSDSYDPDGATQNFQATNTNNIDINNIGTFYGCRFDASRDLFFGSNYLGQKFVDCHFDVGDNENLWTSGTPLFVNCTFTSDDTVNRNNHSWQCGAPAGSMPIHLTGCTFDSSWQYRQTVMYSTNTDVEFVGCDLSGYTRNPVGLIHAASYGTFRLIDCKLPANYAAFTSSGNRKRRLEMFRCNSTDDIEVHDENGSLISEATIVRTGGAAKSLEITTTSRCGKTNIFYTPWFYAEADAAESKNFDIHIAYSGTQLTKEEIFAELEFMDSASTPYGTRATSQEKSSLGDAVGNNATASETWGGSETYEEYIRITETVGVANSYVRMRIGIEKTSQSDEIYVDPNIEIS